MSDIRPPITTTNIPLVWNTVDSYIVALTAVDQAETIYDVPVGVKATYLTSDSIDPNPSSPSQIAVGYLITFKSYWTISGQGTIPIKYYSTDNNDNAEIFKTEYLYLDNVAPVTQVIAPLPGGSDNWYISNPSISLSATDASSGVNQTYYKWDDALSWTTYSSSFQIPSEGVHTLYFYSDDIAGNVESVKSQAFKYDLEPPFTEDDAPEGLQKQPVTIHFFYSDNASGVIKTFFTLDGSTPTTSSSSGSSVTISQSGTYTLKYFSIDYAGNTESVKESLVQISIDTTAPNVYISEAGGIWGTNGWYRTTPTISLSATDPSGVQAIYYKLYQVGEVTTAKYTSPIDLSAPINLNAVYNISLEIDQSGVRYDVDLRGIIPSQTTIVEIINAINLAVGQTIATETNAQGETGTGYITLTSTKAGLADPTAEIKFIQPLSKDATQTIFGLNTTYPHTFTETVLFVTYSGSFTLPLDGQWKIEYYAEDNEGNVGEIASKQYKLDSVSPVTAVVNSSIPDKYSFSISSVIVLPSIGDQYKEQTFVFSVSGIAVLPVIGDQYSNNSSVFSIDYVSASVIRCHRISGTNNPVLAGVLTRVTGSSDVNISFSAYSINLNSYQIEYISSSIIVAQKTSGSTDSYSPAALIKVTGVGDSIIAYSSINDWYHVSPNITLTATDSLSGIYRTFYQWDNIYPVILYTGGIINVPSQGIHVLSVWSIDYAGNIETQVQKTYSLDITAPITTDNTLNFTGIILTTEANGYQQIINEDSDILSGILVRTTNVNIKSVTRFYNVTKSVYYDVESISGTDENELTVYPITTQTATRIDNWTITVASPVFVGTTKILNIYNQTKQIYYEGTISGPNVIVSGEYPVSFGDVVQITYTYNLPLTPTFPGPKDVIEIDYYYDYSAEPEMLNTNDFTVVEHTPVYIHDHDIIVTLFPYSSYSPIVNTYYTIDGTTPTTSSPSGTQVSLTESGDYTIKYFSVNASGIAEIPHDARFVVRIDKKLPIVTLSTDPIDGDNGWHKTDFKLFTNLESSIAIQRLDRPISSVSSYRVFTAENDTIDFAYPSGGTVYVAHLASIEITSTNEDLDLYVDGNYVTVTIPSTIYSVEDLVSTIETQLGLLLFNLHISFNATTKKYTLYRTSGAFDILFATGTSTATSIATVLGFYKEDKTGLGTYTSDFGVKTSYEYANATDLATEIQNRLNAIVSLGNWIITDNSFSYTFSFNFFNSLPSTFDLLFSSSARSAAKLLGFSASDKTALDSYDSDWYRLKLQDKFFKSIESINVVGGSLTYQGFDRGGSGFYDEILVSGTLPGSSSDITLDYHHFVGIDKVELGLDNPASILSTINIAGDLDKFDGYSEYNLLGVGTVTTNSTTAIVGINTKFTEAFQIGDKIIVQGDSTFRNVATITDDTHLTVTTPVSITASNIQYHFTENDIVFSTVTVTDPSPFYLTTDGIHTIYAKTYDENSIATTGIPQKVSRQDSLIFKLDRLTPNTIDYVPSSSPLSWLKAPLTILLYSDDPIIPPIPPISGDGSGVKNVHFTLDGSLPDIYSPAATANAQFEFTVSGVSIPYPSIGSYYSNNGSTFAIDYVENNLIRTHRIAGISDPTPSGNLIFVSGTGDVTIAFSSVDPITHYTIIASSGNPHTLRYFAIDYAGNQEAPSVGTDIYLDASIPVSSIATIPISPDGTNSWFKTQPQVSFSAIDTESGILKIQYRFNPSTVWIDYTVPFVLSDGTTKIEHRSIDNAGNIESFQTATIKVDTVAPVTTTDIPITAWSSNSHVEFTVSDVGSGNYRTYFTIDGTTPTTLSAFGDYIDFASSGIYTIKYFSVDNAGNQESPYLTQTLQLDLEPPIISNLSIERTIFSYTDQGSGIVRLALTTAIPISFIGNTLNIKITGSINYNGFYEATCIDTTHLDILAIYVLEAGSSILYSTDLIGTAITFDVTDLLSGVDINTVIFDVDGIEFSTIKNSSSFSYTGTPASYTIQISPVQNVLAFEDVQILKIKNAADLAGS